MSVILSNDRMQGKFGPGYCKVSVLGLVLEVEDEAEKRHGLECNLKKHDRNYLKRSEKLIKNLMKRSRVTKMTTRSFSGKAWVI